ncbi:hypothetical protein [Flavivirga sp. 57AJ16]|uniref:hypothetical protein n=1 Tax=Flavivirga sp. 57AJ16 TaxID=3025307 RepID=UPI002366C2D0|nr:hypothetical protein [Flavivirga sp. 57AJ16]MDD7886633.1 hypothetical protein [Flavivirga sp. 57AJ16]
MKLEQWTLFIDMLGYGNINGNITNENEAKDFIKFMQSNVSIFIKQDNDGKKKIYENQEFDLYKYYDIQTALVSDSLIINYLPKEVNEEIVEGKRILHSANTFFIIINRLQEYIYNCMSNKSILIRGGVSNKYCLVENNFAVGEGVIDAYIQESKFAVFPRIAISKNITNNKPLIKAFDFLCKAIYNETSFLEKCENDIYYIDYLKHNISLTKKNPFSLLTINKFIEVHKNTISKNLEKIQEQINSLQEVDNDFELKKGKLKRSEKKILWLKNYHNQKMHEFNKDYIIE